MIGKILKTMRKSSKLSQEQISKLVGYTRNTISQYETGTIEPDFKTIEKKIANLCGYEILFINKEQDITLNSENIDRNEL
mgnify:CR=1 FL=1